MCISKPHLMRTTHMSTPGSNAFRATSVSIRLLGFPEPTVGCPPPQLLEPTHRPRTGRDSPAIHLEEASLRVISFNDSYGVPRSGTGVRSGWTGRSAAALPVYPSRTPRIHATARRTCAASRRAHSLTLLVERKHRESPPGRQSQPRGVRAHGAPLEAGNRCGAGTGGIADHSTSDRRSPNLACKMRQRHAARVQRPHGQTPEAIRPNSEEGGKRRHK